MLLSREHTELKRVSMESDINNEIIHSFPYKLKRFTCNKIIIVNQEYILAKMNG